MVDIISLLSTDGYIICNKQLIRLYGTDCAVILGELCSEHNYYKAMNELNEDGSFYSTQDNIEENTGINAYHQRIAIKTLQDAGILKVVKKGLPAKNHFIINSEKLAEVYSDHSASMAKGLVVQNLNINNNKQTIIKSTLSKDNVLNDADDSAYEKPKRKNLYQKCLDMIYEFTNDGKLTELLIQYLNLLLEKSQNEGKPLYANQFKGMLNKLDEICVDGHYGDVVQQSIQKGYIGFFPVSSYNKPKNYVPDTNKAPQRKAGKKATNEDGTLKEY